MAGKAYVPPDNGENWWRDIPGYGGKYRVNRNGDIQRVFYSGLVRDMTPYKKVGGTPKDKLYVKLTIDGRAKDVSVMDIMARTWHKNTRKDFVPYHKNGIVIDNHVDNIGFISRKELGRLTGHMTQKRKCVFKVTADGEQIEIYRSARAAAKANNISYQAVLDRCNGKVKKPFALDGYSYQFEE